MALIREKRRNKFTQIPNKILQSTNMSFAAKGLLSTLLSYPDDWKFYKSFLVKMSPKEGKDAVQTIIVELTNLGYITPGKQTRDKKTGQFSTVDWIVREIPVKPDKHKEKSPLRINRSGSAVNGPAAAANPPLQILNKTNTKLTNTNNKSLSNEREERDLITPVVKDNLDLITNKFNKAKKPLSKTATNKLIKALEKLDLDDDSYLKIRRVTELALERAEYPLGYLLKCLQDLDSTNFELPSKRGTPTTVVDWDNYHPESEGDTPDLSREEINKIFKSYADKE